MAQWKCLPSFISTKNLYNTGILAYEWFFGFRIFIFEQHFNQFAIFYIHLFACDKFIFNFAKAPNAADLHCLQP
jgi:hypothetical protein